MAQGPSGTILVAIWIMLRIRESKVRNPDPPDRRRFVLSEHSFLVATVVVVLSDVEVITTLQVHKINFICNLTEVVTL